MHKIIVKYCSTGCESTHNFNIQGSVFDQQTLIGCLEHINSDKNEIIAILLDNTEEDYCQDKTELNHCNDDITSRKTTITTIGNECFKDCINLKQLSLPETVSNIGSHALENCQSIEYLKLPDDIKECSIALCRGCSMLREVILPKACTSIKQSCFSQCANLESVTWPCLLESIERLAFANTRLKIMVCPSSVKNIHMQAFADSQLSCLVLHNPKTIVNTKGLPKTCKLLRHEATDIALKDLETSNLFVKKRFKLSPGQYNNQLLFEWIDPLKPELVTSTFFIENITVEPMNTDHYNLVFELADTNRQSEFYYHWILPDINITTTESDRKGQQWQVIVIGLWSIHHAKLFYRKQITQTMNISPLISAFMPIQIKLWLQKDNVQKNHEKEQTAVSCELTNKVDMDVLSNMMIEHCKFIDLLSFFSTARHIKINLTGKYLEKTNHSN